MNALKFLKNQQRFLKLTSNSEEVAHQGETQNTQGPYESQFLGWNRPH